MLCCKPRSPTGAGAVDVDLAAVFDTQRLLRLALLQSARVGRRWSSGRGIDCFGIYKIQRGFDGYVTEGVHLDKIYPLLVIWHADNP